MDMLAYQAQPQRRRVADSSRVRRAQFSLAATAVAIALLCLIFSAEYGFPARAAWVTPVAASLSDIPSHNGVYRASIIGSPNLMELGRPVALTVEIRTVADAPVEGALLELESRMPDDESVSVARSPAIQEIGGGLYRVEGLRFHSRGWWNLKLQISTRGMTDSLAFNLVLR
jgi:hypothetical protein